MAGPPDTQFARSGDVDIAYQVIGEGDRDLVMTMGWVTNLDVMWELPELAGFLDSLSRLGRLVIFDKRGTGLSDRITGMATLEERADDIGAVMDAVGSKEAALVGWGDGAAIAAMFASSHPSRGLRSRSFDTDDYLQGRVGCPRSGHDGRDAPGGRTRLGQRALSPGGGTSARRRSTYPGLVAPLGTTIGDPERRGQASRVGGRDRPPSGSASGASANALPRTL